MFTNKLISSIITTVTTGFSMITRYTGSSGRLRISDVTWQALHTKWDESFRSLCHERYGFALQDGLLL